MSHTVPIHRSLVTNLTAIVLLLGGAMLALTYLGSSRALRRFSASILEQTVERAQVELEGFFHPVDRQLGLMREWASAGLLRVDDPLASDALLMPILREYPWITSAIIADDAGREHMLLRTGEQWSSRQSLVGEPARWRRWVDGDDPAVVEEPLDYDPRSRPWYTGAVSAGDDVIHWTEPYTFFTTQDPGITASLAFEMDGERRVLGLDVTLTDLSHFTTDIHVLTHGRAFALSEDGRVVGLPRSDRFTDEESFNRALLKRPEDLGVPLARDVSRALLGGEALDRPTRFTSEGTAWWGQVRPFELGGGHRLLIGVAVPESEMVGAVLRQRIGIAAVTLLILGLGIARVFVLAHRYSEPLEELVQESARISQGDLDPAEPVQTDVREVRRLAEAHETMRQGLQTLLKIEGDLRVARRIQQSTFPQSLPQLPGFDIDAWSEPADETGGDTYDIIGLGEASVSDQILLTEGEAGKAVMLMADATGHGIGPALSVTQARAMLRVAVHLTQDLGEIAKLLNEQLNQDLPPGRFVTAWFGALDTESSTLTTFSAGQAPLLHYRASEDDGRVLDASTIALGMLPFLKSTESTTISMEPGDVYLVFSDGIYESMDTQDEEFGEARTLDLIRKHKDESAAAIMKHIRDAVDEFTGGAPAADDRTGILIKRL